MQEESQPIIPSSNIALQARNDLLHLAGWVLTAMLCSVAAIATLVFPQFEQTFSAFGADLPTITLLLLRYRFLWWLLPVISLSMSLVLASQKQHPVQRQYRIMIGLAALFVVSLILVIAGVVAMYYPIFHLGQPI